jgi:YggT family protein
MWYLLRILSGLINIYMMVILIRVMLTWFSGLNDTGLAGLLSRVTDPYLNWFRRFSVLRIGYLDLSPIAAMAVLSLVNRMLTIITISGRISLGIILALILSAVWSAASFLLGFCAIIIGLRIIAYLTNRNIHGFFWNIIETISRPILYRINRIIFPGRMVRYLTGLIVSLAVLGGAFLIGGKLISLAAGLLIALPF